MKHNRSLAISNEILDFKTKNSIGVIENYFPNEIFDKDIDIEFSSKSIKERERVFTVPNTLLLMVLSSIQEDKSLQNSVDMFYTIHQNNKLKIKEILNNEAINKKKLDDLKHKKTAGRPMKYNISLPKSQENDISLNTAAFSNARKRVPMEIINKLFEKSKINDAKNDYSHWHGLKVFSGDGTYLQMQDNVKIREQFEVKNKGVSSDGYPQGLLEVIIERGTGQVFDFDLSNRHVSELLLIYNMLDKLPPNSILLLDDLYNCYEIICKCIRLGIEIVVPAKRERNYTVFEKIEEGDEIMKIHAPKKRSKWLTENEKEKSINIRLINCKSPDGKDYKLLTTILDKKISKEEFQVLYTTRWDIEIGIREIKTIMDINILRSKTPEMALKELMVSLSTYNIIRKVIYAATKELPFFPKDDIIQKFYTQNKAICVDKKGRVYNRWSTGRRKTKEINS